MNRSLVLFLSFWLPATGLAIVDAAPAQARGFTPQCDLPFPTIAQRTKFDDKCPIEGKLGASQATEEQDLVKNELCASGSVESLDEKDFARLQKNLDDKGIGYGFPKGLQGPRSQLKRMLVLDDGTEIGKGTVVEYTGYMLGPHYSDIARGHPQDVQGKWGESVNCNYPDPYENDIHIPIVQVPATDPGADECKSLTAEIIPHYRPAELTEDNLKRVSNPVRFKGQLFFDASHKPSCKQHPFRMTSWEIHPIYALDVCKAATLDACPIDDDSKWTPIETWLSEHPS